MNIKTPESLQEKIELLETQIKLLETQIQLQNQRIESLEIHNEARAGWQMLIKTDFPYERLAQLEASIVELRKFKEGHKCPTPNEHMSDDCPLWEMKCEKTRGGRTHSALNDLKLATHYCRFCGTNCRDLKQTCNSVL